MFANGSLLLFNVNVKDAGLYLCRHFVRHYGLDRVEEMKGHVEVIPYPGTYMGEWRVAPYLSVTRYIHQTPENRLVLHTQYPTEAMHCYACNSFTDP